MIFVDDFALADPEVDRALRQIIKSRSMEKRIAIQKGEALPEFNDRPVDYRAGFDVMEWAKRWNREVDDA